MSETAGSLSLKAKADKTKYDPLEVGHALTDDVYQQLLICANRHLDIFDEPEFFLSLIVAGDPLIHGIRRHKYAAWLYLPSPRPQQSVYHYDRRSERITRLWSLPNAKVMAIISEMPSVGMPWLATKVWCDAFYNKRFWHEIRAQHGRDDWLSEHEFLNAHRKELVESSLDEVSTNSPEAFDFSKVSAYKIVDPNATIAS